MGFVWSDVKPSRLINSNRAAFWIPGFATASWGPFIPYVKENFGLSEDNLGLLLMCMAVGAVCSLLFASRFMTKFGCRLVVQFCGVVVALCLASVTVIPNFYCLCVVLFLFGLNCECLSIAANVNAGALEALLKRNIMSGLHGVYSLGNTVGVFLVALFLGAGLTFIGHNLLLTSALLPVLVILYCALIASRYLLTDLSVVDEQRQKDEAANAKNADDSEAAKAETAKAKNGKSPFITLIVFMLGCICFVMFIVEGSMMDWTGVFLNTIKGVPLHEAGYGFAAFAVMMTVCRLTGDKIVSTLGRRRVMVIGAIFAASGIALAVTVPHPMLSIIGFAMVGVGAANIVPQAISYAATETRMPIQRSILLVNAIGYIGGLFGPAVIGFVAHRIGLEYTFLILASGVLLVSLISYVKIRSGSLESLKNAANAAANAAANTTANATAKASAE